MRILYSQVQNIPIKFPTQRQTSSLSFQPIETTIVHISTWILTLIPLNATLRSTPH